MNDEINDGHIFYIDTYDYGYNGEPETVRRKNRPKIEKLIKNDLLDENIIKDLNYNLRDMNRLYKKYGVIGTDNKIIYDVFSLQRDYPRYVEFLDITIDNLLKQALNKSYPAEKN